MFSIGFCAFGWKSNLLCEFYHFFNFPTFNQSIALAKRLQADLEEERALNKSLLQNQEMWQSRTNKAEFEAKETRGEYNELLLNLQLRDKIDELTSREEVIIYNFVKICIDDNLS